MGILTDYFSAPDDAQAGRAARTGPSSPDPLTNQPVFPTVELKGIDPFVGKSLGDIEKHYIIETLKLAGGNREEASKLLGIGERTLYRKLKEYGG